MNSLSSVLLKPAIAAIARKGPEFLSTERLPVGLTVTFLKESAGPLDIRVPAFEEEGLMLTFMHCKGNLQLSFGDGHDHMQITSPGLALLSAGNRSLHFSSVSPVSVSAVILFLGKAWINSFMKDNVHFSKIEQVVEEEQRLVCKLGRRQMAQLDAIIAGNRTAKGRLLEIQNNALSLVEYFLTNRHRSLLGPNTSATIDNKDDLSLIREVESYISEYYCSDTFTVDSILKKTYTSYHKLNFLFKSIHGMTISEYIRNKRIERSKEMIADNAKSISQIAYEIGYSSISNYILAFKKIYQITPGKYKKQMVSVA